jgi:hypothetical protein
MLVKDLLDYAFGNTPYIPPTTWYVALLTDSNTQAQRFAGTYTEMLVNNGYSRFSFANSGSNWQLASSMIPVIKRNNVVIDFTATGSSFNAPATALAFFKQSSNGLPEFVQNFTVPIVINLGDPLTIPLSALQITLSVGT